MNKLLQKELKKYYQDVRKHLFGKIANRRKFLNSLKLSIENYIEENSITDMTLIYEQFGTPEEVVEAFLENQSPLELTRNIRRLRMFQILTISVILAMVLFFCYFVHELREGYGRKIEIIIQEEYSDMQK